jgi:hypothetical protein
MTNNSLVATTPPIDLLKESALHLMAVSFPKSRAASYQASVNIAKQAMLYSEMEIGGETFHHAVFGRDAEDASRAYSLVKYLTSLKGVQIFAGGKIIQNPVRVGSVLSCYLEAIACNDWRAHCFQVIDSPYKRTKEEMDEAFQDALDINKMPNGTTRPRVKYLFPCSFIYRFERLLITTDHPSSPENQIQARAIEHGCDWCPQFDQNGFKKLPIS